MTEVRLAGLEGSNPLGFFAALGVLAVGERMLPDAGLRLSWAPEVVPVAVAHGDVTAGDLVAAVLADRDRWRPSPALDFAVGGTPIGDVKLTREPLREWLAACAAAAPGDGGRALGLVSALVAEGSVANKGDAKPTDLHFTAGRQQLVEMARTLRDALTAEHVEEALLGPWRYDSTLPSFMWDVADDRMYALSATNPASDTKHTVPGAEWLALLGLAFLPVARGPGRTVTTGCRGTWKEGAYTWPVWEAALTASEARTLVGLAELREDPLPPSVLDRGASRVFRSIITRSDQGGYGTFRPPRTLLDAVAT